MASAAAAPQHLLPAGVSAAECYNYPFCNAAAPAAAPVAAVAYHAAPAPVAPAADPNLAVYHQKNARIAQTYQAVAHAALPQVPGLAQHQQAEALVYAQQGKVPATNIHRANEDRVRQAEEILIQLQHEQAAGILY